jgi:hypothetical protein
VALSINLVFFSYCSHLVYMEVPLATVSAVADGLLSESSSRSQDLLDLFFLLQL